MISYQVNFIKSQNITLIGEYPQSSVQRLVDWRRMPNG
jgi:hypothetical protein